MKAPSDWHDALASLIPDIPDITQSNEPADTDTTGKTPVDTLHVQTERKGRAGKVATIVYGFTGGDDDVARVASELKRRLGTGGSSRGGEILIQGDRRSDVAEALRRMGYKVKA